MGKLFAIDGTDGSGKQTQFNKLCERLSEQGIDFRTVSFPNYESESSALVKMYLLIHPLSNDYWPRHSL